MKSVAEITQGLAEMTGTEGYHRHSVSKSFLMTDGVVYLAEAAEAHWFTDIIASYQHEAKVRAEEFQVWKLKVKDNKGVVTMTDGNSDEPIVSQDIEFTDFPLDMN